MMLVVAQAPAVFRLQGFGFRVSGYPSCHPEAKSRAGRSEGMWEPHVQRNLGFSEKMEYYKAPLLQTARFACS